MSFHTLLLLHIYWIYFISAAEDCSKYDIDPSVMLVDIPEIDPKSGIAQVFKNLHGKLNARRIVNPTTGIPCYEWQCQSPERQGETCRWCLPSVFVAGFSKCGTTALCDKLEKHPDIRVYRKKEINIFSKLSYNISIFEHKVEDTIDYDFYNYRLHKMARLSSIRNSTTEDIANAKRGDHWMDCTAGAFRDFNAAAHLLKHSPLTKIIMIVRDPWQNMGSRISQQIRHGRAPKGKIAELTHEFKRHQYPPLQRFTSKTISQLASGTDYAYAEKLLYWRAAFPSNSSLLILDQFDLQHRPNETMHRIEHFLNLSQYSYPDAVLQSVSHNANLLPPSRYSHSKIDNPRNQHNNEMDDGVKEEGGVDIHKPYSFEDKPMLLKLSKGVFSPSLCLFKKVFGWSIRITTASEL